MIVDDHCGFRDALHRLLGGSGDLDVVGAAASGAEAIELVARLAPDVVVMDLAMPGLDGVEATRRICARDDAPVVVALTGSRALWRDARAAGAAHLILKDEDPWQLLASIRTAAAR